VRCEDRPSEEQPRGKQDAEEHRAYRFAATTGIWQTVWLEAVGTSGSVGTSGTAAERPFLERCRIVPDLAAGGFRLVPEVSGGEVSGLRLKVEALLDGRPVGETTMDVEGDGGGLLRVSEQRLWSPDAPALYDLRLQLMQGDAVVDEVEAYAGLREVAIRGREILLNGEPVYQRQVLDQGCWPDGVYTAPSDEALRADVAWIKRLGFNGVRKHQKVEDPRWLYWCDHLGLLVWEEMASNYQDSPRARGWLRREWQEVVRRDVNHPCIVAWVPFNEAWGVRELAVDPDQQAHVAAVVADTREIDPTRPVVDNSGWTHVDTDIADSHHYEPAAALFLDSWRAFYEGDGPQRGRILRSWDGMHQGRA
jgi:beta-galactosidase/beta-glucuronidase